VNGGVCNVKMRLLSRRNGQSVIPLLCLWYCDSGRRISCVVVQERTWSSDGN